MSRMSPFLDLTKQVLTANPVEGEDEDQIRTRQLMLEWGEGTPFWGDYPASWETVRFAKNIFLPGQCKLSGKGFAQKLQRDSPAGTHGAKVKQFGIQPAKFSIVVRMWTAEHLKSFERLVPILKSQRYKTTTTTDAVGYTGNAGGAGFSGVVAGTTKVTKKSIPVGPKPLDVYHPALALFKIRSVHVIDVTFPMPTGEGDVFESTIECEEFVYRPSAVKTASEADSLLVIEKNVGKTAATLALEERAQSKPSKFSKNPPNTGGANGSW